jgi:hypothetical protein
MLGSGAAYAATVTTSVDVAFSNTGTIENSASDTEVDATADAGFSSLGGVSISGFQRADGVSGLTGDMFISNGQAPGLLTGVARQVITETNSSGAAQDYALDFALTGMSFYLNGDFGGVSNGTINPFGGTVDAVGARFSYEVLLDGSSIFFAGLEAYGGGYSGYQIDNAVNASGSVVEFAAFGGGCCDGADILIDDIIGSLSLGNIADGATFEVETILTMEFIANGSENWVSGTLGDPTGLNAGTLTTTAPAIPLPAAGWLLLGALGGLGALKRRKS